MSFVFKYSSDIFITQLREIEMLSEKINILRDSENYVGKYFSKEYINKHVLGFSDQQIKQIQDEIKNEGTDNMENVEGEGPGPELENMTML
jgi:hypothetical protein